MFSRGPRAWEPWTPGRLGPASRVHGTFVSLINLLARSRAFAHAKRARARTWSWPRARLVKWPGRPNRPPWIPPPAGPIASWGRQHTSWVLGRLSASHARLRPISGLMHGYVQAEEACRVVEKKTRFVLIYRLKVDWGHGEASGRPARPPGTAARHAPPPGCWGWGATTARPAARHGPPSNIAGCGGCEVGTTGRPVGTTGRQMWPGSMRGIASWHAIRACMRSPYHPAPAPQLRRPTE